MRNARLISTTVALLLMGGCSAIVQILRPGSQESSVEPEGVETAKVVTGGGSFERSDFFHGHGIGTIWELRVKWPVEEVREKLLLVGDEGAVFLDSQRKTVRRIAYSERMIGDVSLVELERGKRFGFLNGDQSWAQGVVLLDENGQKLWEYEGAGGVDDSAAGDVDGDGKAEVVVGFNGDGGIHLVGLDGKLRWRQPGGNVWHVEMLDTDGDGKQEILHSGGDWDAQMTFRDARGEVIRKLGEWPRWPWQAGRVFQQWPHVAGFTIGRWDDGPTADVMLIPDDRRIHVYRPSGAKVTTLATPGLGRFGTVQSTPFRFAPEENAIAVLVSYSLLKRSVLYIFGRDGHLLYQEVLEGVCGAVLPSVSQRGTSLLVGCRDRVWEFAATKQRGSVRH
jgi:hypothetical protein